MISNFSIKVTTAWGLVLFLCMLPAIQYERFFSLIPLHYPFFIGLVLITYLNYGGRPFIGIPLSFFAFFTLYYLYSISFVPNISSASVYYCLWVSNVFVFYCGVSLNAKGVVFIAEVYCSFILFSLCAGLINLVFFNGSHANPFIAWDKNNFSFAVYLAFMLALLTGRPRPAAIIAVLSVFVFSRTLLLMYIVVGVIVYFRRNHFFTASVAVLVLFAVILGGGLPLVNFGFLGERLSGAFELVGELSLFITTGIEASSVELSDWRRYFLFIANIDIVRESFPLGTGMGLANYLEHFDPYYVTFTNHPGRAHNFIISYLGEMGFLFPIFLMLFLPVFRRAQSRIAFAALVGLFVGLITNEYLTAPMSWLLFGIAINSTIHKD